MLKLNVFYYFAVGNLHVVVLRLSVQRIKDYFVVKSNHFDF